MWDEAKLREVAASVSTLEECLSPLNRDEITMKSWNIRKEERTQKANM